MKFTKTQMNEILQNLASDVGGYQKLIELGLEAMMFAERQVYLNNTILSSEKGNDYRNIHRFRPVRCSSVFVIRQS